MEEETISWGRVLERLDQMNEKQEALIKDVTEIKATMHKGWGIVIAVVAIAGVFANELITAVKRLFGGT